MFAHWRGDIVWEGLCLGKHTRHIRKSYILGFILFLVSESIFFFAFFWAFVYNAVDPKAELNGWPPKGIEIIWPWGIPAVSRGLLVTSRVSANVSQHSMRAGLLGSASVALVLTLLAGIIFCYIQGVEYWNAGFRIRDGVYGRSFFCLTGLHFIHVFLGIVSLTVTLVRLLSSHFSVGHHLFFTFRIWYWHYVDVIWIIPWVTVYVWPYTVDLC